MLEIAAAVVTVLASVVVGLGALSGREGSDSERLAVVVGAGAGGVMLVVTWLGFAGQLSAASVGVGCACLAVLAKLAGGPGATTGGFKALLAAGLRSLRRPGPLWLVALFALWSCVRALSWPDLSWDALTYHLTYPAAWMQDGGFGRFEAGGIWDQYESFPKGGEALFFAAMAPFHDDALVGLANLPLWLGTGAALKGAAQQLGCSPRAASWCAALLLLCPVLSAYVTPAYVEVGSAFAFALALAAGTRAVVAGESRALIALGLAVGLGAAFKSTGLALAPFALIAGLACARRAPPAACARHAAVGLVLALLVAGPWYASNVWLCGNPLYPAPLPGATDGPAAGSLASAWAIAEGSVLRQAALGIVFEHLAAPPWTVPYPLGPGWLYLLALPGCFALALAFARRERAYAAGALAALALALLLIYLLSPWNGVFPEANTRFLAPSLIAAVLGCAVALQAAPRWVARTLTAVPAAAVVLALGSSRLVRERPAFGPAWLVAGLLALALAIAVWSAAADARRRRPGRALVTLVAAMLALPSALAARRAVRSDAITTHTELHPIRTHPQLWTRMSQLPPSRVAFAVGGINSTEGWFFYPLFGADLRHRVRYVDVERADRRACLRRGKLREHADEKVWLQRLRDGEYDYLVTDGGPIEQRWAEGRPEAFKLVLTDAAGRLYAIDRARLR